LAPGNYESAGKRSVWQNAKGNQTLRSGLMQSAHVAAVAHVSSCPVPPVAARRKRATMAVAPQFWSLLIISFNDKNPIANLEPTILTNNVRRHLQLVNRLKQMGYQVTQLQTAASAT